MKYLFVILFFFPCMLFAQVTSHTVAAKESFSSIGRLYNINGRTLAEYNNLNYEGGLSIGQVIKIPATEGAEINKPANPRKDIEIVKPTSGNAIYHTVEKGETLYHLSTLYTQATVENIKSWNNLTSNDLSEGTQLIVGYKAAVNNTEAPKKTPETVVKKEQKIPVTDEVVVRKEASKVSGAVKGNSGFFKTDFDETLEHMSQSGTAGIFKSTSGWQDGKFYCLHNKARQGSIVKVYNDANGKYIFAKVLDVIPDIDQNSNVILRLSNAAADILDVNGSTFKARVEY